MLSALPLLFSALLLLLGMGALGVHLLPSQQRLLAFAVRLLLCSKRCLDAGRVQFAVDSHQRKKSPLKPR